MRSLKALMLSCTLTAAILTGCASTPDKATDENGDYHPSLQMTVTANSVSSWDFSPIKFYYRQGTSEGTDKKGVWTRFIGEATVQRFESLGFHYVENEADADYVITTTLLGEGAEHSKLFSNLDPGVDAQQKGSISISIVDRLTNRPVWEGIIQAYSDYPIATASQRKVASYQLINQLTLRLPEVH
ncbi:MAG: hypothetical protein ACI4VX_02005 [Succinivibrionaceae bacterium]